MTKKELKVSAIHNGTVIDHILPGKAFEVVKILHLDTYPGTVTIASKVPSRFSEKKDIIKIENRALSQKEVSSIALISPNATVNIIENYEVKEKRNIRLPAIIENILKCTNPLCITNFENIDTKFNVKKKNPLLLRCHYCERTMDEKDVLKVLG
ncbi:MAG: aspartate carbamoyltransferase regulatory subunit [Candidatus Methanofastidiosia archaeon]